MKNIFENLDKKEVNFVKPLLDTEAGEIRRVAELFSPSDHEIFIENFTKVYEDAQLVDLTEQDWKILDNTDSFDIEYDDWDTVAMHASQGNRDWESLKLKMESEGEIDAPIILRKGGTLHLVSGNTRLMIARALGKTPKVVIVDMV